MDLLKKVLQLLEKDARLSASQIATLLGVGVDEVENIIRKAKEDRLILKYKALINWDRIEDEHVWALIEVKVAPERETGFTAIADEICRFPEADSVYLVSGGFDLAVIARGTNMRQIASFVTQKLAPISGVQSTATHFLLKKYKEEGEIIEGDEEAKRQPLIL